MVQHDAAVPAQTPAIFHIRVTGPMDGPGSSKLKPQVFWAAEHGYKELVLDVHRVPYIETSGVRMLQRLFDHFDGLHVSIVHANQSVSRVFDLLHVQEHYPVSLWP